MQKEQLRMNNRLRANLEAMRYNLERDYLKQKNTVLHRTQLNDFVYDLLINVASTHSVITSDLERDIKE